MSVVLIQLSDIHFKVNGINPLLERVDQLSSALISSARDAETCLLLITGDVAFSGAVEEYVIAQKFFEDLSTKLKAGLNNVSVKLIFIPGNHDCDFSQKNNVREIVLPQVSVERDAPADVVESLIVVQSNYFEFVSTWNRDDISQLTDDIFKQIRFSMPDGEIELNLINSAWMSTLHEQPGKLLFPAARISANNPEEEASTLAITLLHHPYQWFDPINARSLRAVIETMSDIVFTGHEHDSGSYRKSHKKQQMEYVEAGVLQGDSRNLCEFNVVRVDLQNQQYVVNVFSWYDKDRYFKSEISESVRFTRNSYRLRNEYNLTDFCEKELSDPGVKFSHPNKETISLQDIFVYPPIRQLHLPGAPEWIKTMVQGSIDDFLLNNPQILFIGEEKSGKSSFAKVIFRDLIKREFIPLLVSGGNFKGFDDASIESTLKKHYEATYSSPDFQKFDQLNRERKVLIIDDYHKCHLNIKGRDQLIRGLQKRFDRIVLFGNDQLRFSDLIGEKTGQNLSFWDFSTCEIMEFGKLKRKDLIEKWYLAGNIYTADEASLKQDAIRAEKVISSLIGNNFVPSFPLFILAMLQQLQIQNPVETTAGSYGYLYESLLTISLSKNPYLDNDIDTQYSYLSELAYVLFLQRSSSMDLSQLEDWHLEYCDKYRLTINKDDLMGYLDGVGILNVDNSEVSFRYPYIYYYFAARYFRDHITENEIRLHVERMSERLHHTESANIIIFLCYLSKDPFILSKLLEASKRLFATYAECDLVADTKVISNLIPDVPQVVLDGKTVDENHRNMLTEEDQISEDVNARSEEEIDDDKPDKDLQEVLQINVAFKTIQILGQLLRNFPGSLKGDQKYMLAQECYSLGLRVMSFGLSSVQENQQEMVQNLGEILKSKHPRWPYAKLNEEVKHLMFGVLEGLAFAIIKHTSDSVGLERLSLTYNDLLKSNRNISYKFIDLEVRLENFKGFPKNETFDLYKAVYKNQFSAQLIRHLVWHYFYIYPAKHELKQSICDKLGIQIKPVISPQSSKLLNG